jgi:asparagine synthase (glutamine-hydrolysing)
MAAARNQGIKFGGALTVVTSDKSPDLGYSSACAEEHGVPHHIVRLTADELVDEYLPEIIRLLKIYDGMVLRNSLVIAAVFKKAAELGFKYAITGDGADELFGGYSFMWSHKDAAVWKEKRDSMCAKWTFSTDELAENYGITAYSPYTSDKTSKWAIANTERSDCIDVRPIQLLYGGEYIEHEQGKIILREAYDTVSSWRRKDPIEVGSGATIIGMDSYWSDRISDAEYENETKALAERGYVVNSKEHLVNFRIWEQIFGQDGIKMADVKRLPVGEGCAGCCLDIGTEKMFCNLCGAYPAQRSC